MRFDEDAPTLCGAGDRRVASSRLYDTSTCTHAPSPFLAGTDGGSGSPDDERRGKLMARGGNVALDDDEA
jgi:hypothetical protein